MPHLLVIITCDCTITAYASLFRTMQTMIITLIWFLENGGIGRYPLSSFGLRFWLSHISAKLALTFCARTKTKSIHCVPTANRKRRGESSSMGRNRPYVSHIIRIHRKKIWKAPLIRNRKYASFANSKESIWNQSESLSRITWPWKRWLSNFQGNLIAFHMRMSLAYAYANSMSTAQKGRRNKFVPRIRRKPNDKQRAARSAKWIRRTSRGPTPSIPRNSICTFICNIKSGPSRYDDEEATGANKNRENRSARASCAGATERQSINFIESRSRVRAAFLLLAFASYCSRSNRSKHRRLNEKYVWMVDSGGTVRSSFFPVVCIGCLFIMPFLRSNVFLRLFFARIHSFAFVVVRQTNERTNQTYVSPFHDLFILYIPIDLETLPLSLSFGSHFFVLFFGI